MKFLFSKVSGRGVPPVAFLNELVKWGKQTDDSLFEPNDEPNDVMGVLQPILGPWKDLTHRKCAMLELLRVLAGFESNWHWNEGVDTTNNRSLSDIKCQEAGIFQISYDSTGLDRSGKLKEFLQSKGINNAAQFILKIKQDHVLEFEYAIRLLRISYRWDGPIKRGEINSSLNKDAVEEFRTLIT